MHIPSPSQFSTINKSERKATFIFEPFYPGYGTTVGNALRRVLLSSLEGTAISGVKIKGVSHEFSTLPGVREDFVDIVLNLKGVIIKAESYVDLSALRLGLSVKGEKRVTAGDIALPTGVEVLNPEHTLLHLTSPSASLEMEITLSRGRGFLPIENREQEDRELGFIAIDSLFSPVVKVGFTVEDVRVGQMTNYDKVVLDVETNGALSPQEAVEQSLSILIDQFKNLLSLVHTSSGTTQIVSGAADAESVRQDDQKEELDGNVQKEFPEESGVEKLNKKSKKKKEE